MDNYRRLHRSTVDTICRSDPIWDDFTYPPCRALFEYLGRQQLSRLTSSDCPGLAIQAYWERSKIAIPAGFTPSKWGLDPTKLERFFGFAEGRLGTQIPDWWQESVRSACVWPGEGISFSVSKLDFVEHAAVPGLRVSKDVVIQIADGAVVIKTEEETMRIQRSLLRELQRKYSVDTLSASPGGAQSFVALYSPEGFSYPLVCVDSALGRAEWRAKVWAAGALEGAAVGSSHRVEVCRIGDTVLVFGVQSGAAYLEAFDAKIGLPRFRFCSSYWGNPSETWRL
jgi:hypothetical protein